MARSWLLLTLVLASCAPRGDFWTEEDLGPPQLSKEPAECQELRANRSLIEEIGYARSHRTCRTMSYHKEFRPRSGGPDYVNLKPTDIEVCEGSYRDSPVLGIAIRMRRLRCAQ